MRNFPIVSNILNFYYTGTLLVNPLKNQPVYKQHSNSGMTAPRIAAIKGKQSEKIYSGITKMTDVASFIIKFRKVSGFTHEA